MDGPLELEFEHGGATLRARFIRGGLGGALLSGEHPPAGELVRFRVLGGGLPDRHVRGLGRVLRAAVGGGDDLFGLKLLRLECGEGLPPLKELLRHHLHTELSDLPRDQVLRIANWWAVSCAPDDPDGVVRRPDAIESDAILGWFRPPGRTPVLNVYVRRTVAYLVNFVPFYGRGARLNETSFLIHTNTVLPSLGSRVLVQIPTKLPDEDGWVVLQGAVQRRADQKDQSVYKGSFEMRVDRAEEIGAPGLLFRLLESLRHDDDR